jgi:hypothetical protein
MNKPCDYCHSDKEDSCILTCPEMHQWPKMRGGDRMPLGGDKNNGMSDYTECQIIGSHCDSSKPCIYENRWGDCELFDQRPKIC